MNNTRLKAIKRVLDGRVRKSELKILMDWADKEIEEWTVLKKICREQWEKLL